MLNWRVLVWNWGVLVWNWGVCWTERFLVWNWGIFGAEKARLKAWSLYVELRGVWNWEIFGKLTCCSIIKFKNKISFLIIKTHDIYFFISVKHEKRYFLKATGHCGQLFSIANFFNFYNLPIIAKCASALGRVWISANVGLRFIILITQFITWSSSSVFIRRYPFKLSPRTLRWSGFILSLAISYAVRSVTFSTSCCVFVAILIGTLRSEISFSFFSTGRLSET